MAGEEHKLRVLVVEDDQFISEMVMSALTNDGFQTYHTANGDAAVRMTEQVMPQVIILDLMLPGMSGEEILMSLKSNAELKKIPVLVFTNRSEVNDVEKLMELGAADYMIKVETELSVLLKKVRELGNTLQ